jgi:hypothetical protein
MAHSIKKLVIPQNAMRDQRSFHGVGEHIPVLGFAAAAAAITGRHLSPAVLESKVPDTGIISTPSVMNSTCDDKKNFKGVLVLKTVWKWVSFQA